MVQSKPVVIDTACDWVKVITLTAYEIALVDKGEISAGTARSILAHNRAVTKNCGASK